MENYGSFDKINIPIYICDKNWKIVFRNIACKKYTKTPRLNGTLLKCFIDKEGTVFPRENGEAVFISCILNEAYKTALCFEYHSKAIVLFPTLLEFDLLFGDISGKTTAGLADALRQLFDVLITKDVENKDKYGTFEKIRRYIFSALENYIALALFDTEKRVLGSFTQIYNYFTKEMTKVFNQSGCKVETRLSGIADLGHIIYTDTLYFTTVLSSFLLFCLSVSDDKKCVIIPEHLGTKVRHTLLFTCKNPALERKRGVNFRDWMKVFPDHYLNVLPFEALCSNLWWNLNYIITDKDELNAAIWFEIEDNFTLKFRSPPRIQYTPEQIMDRILSNAFLSWKNSVIQ